MSQDNCLSSRKMLHLRNINTENGNKACDRAAVYCWFSSAFTQLKSWSDLNVFKTRTIVRHITSRVQCPQKGVDTLFVVAFRLTECTLGCINDACLLCHSGIHIVIVWIYKELSVLWWSRRVLSSLGLTLHILFHSLFLLPLINILFKQPADTPRRQYVHKSSGADQHNGPHSWHLKSLISLRILSTRDSNSRNMTLEQKQFYTRVCLFHLACYMVHFGGGGRLSSALPL